MDSRFIRAADALAGPVGHAVRGMIIDVLRDPALAGAQIVDPGTALVLELLRRVAARGDVRPEALTPRIAGVGPALLRHHFLLHGSPIDDEILIGIVDQIILPLVRADRDEGDANLTLRDLEQANVTRGRPQG